MRCGLDFREKLEGHAVHAVAEVCWLRAIVEHVAEVPLALLAPDLRVQQRTLVRDGREKG